MRTISKKVKESELIDLLSLHFTTAKSLDEIAKKLRADKGEIIPMLNELRDRGFVIQIAHRTWDAKNERYEEPSGKYYLSTSGANYKTQRLN